MQPTRVFWLSSKKPVNNTFSLNGESLYLDTTYEPEWHVNQEAYVYKTAVMPEYKEHDIKEGEKALVHHNVPTAPDRHVDWIEDEKVFWSHQTEIFCTISEEGEIKMQYPWILVKPVPQPKPTSEIIYIPNEENKMWEQRGRVAHINNQSEEHGINDGDLIYFSKNSDYEIEVEGEKYYRMRNDDVILVYGE